MMLWERMAREVYPIEAVQSPDGEGGIETTLKRGEPFMAALTGYGSDGESSDSRRLDGTFAVTSWREFRYGELFEDAGGTRYRVVSNPQRGEGTLRFHRCNARIWEEVGHEQTSGA
mgnify:FL=1